MKEDLDMAKKELEELKEQSFAMDLLKDYKKQNKRQFIIILVTLPSERFIHYIINYCNYEV